MEIDGETEGSCGIVSKETKGCVAPPMHKPTNHSCVVVVIDVELLIAERLTADSALSVVLIQERVIRVDGQSEVLAQVAGTRGAGL